MTCLDCRDTGFVDHALWAIARCHCRSAPGGFPVTEKGATMREPILQFFAFDHLPEHLAAVSGRFCDVAHSLVATLPRNPERTVALRKLLEAKDAAVRAAIYKEEPAVAQTAA